MLSYRFIFAEFNLNFLNRRDQALVLKSVFDTDAAVVSTELFMRGVYEFISTFGTGQFPYWVCRYRIQDKGCSKP